MARVAHVTTAHIVGCNRFAKKSIVPISCIDNGLIQSDAKRGMIICIGEQPRTGIVHRRPVARLGTPEAAEGVDSQMERPDALGDYGRWRWHAPERACPATQIIRPGSVGVQHQLLHPPVEQFAHVQHVLARAGQAMDPAELLELLAGAAQCAQHRAVELHLVDAAWVGV